MIYLDEYRYDTPDGYASRVLAIASLRDVLDAFDAEGVPSRDQLDARVAADIEALAALQNDDGGWSWWSRGLTSIPWQTLHVTHALVVARDAGYAVPTDTLDRALAHLADIESFIPPEYGDDVRITIEAYAIHVRAMAGDRDVPKATQIYRTAGIALQLDAVAWLWPAIDDPEIRTEIERLFTNRAVETAGAATFATAYSEDAYVIAPSDRRTDGVILDALITQAPASDLIPKVVAGLLGDQVRGRWNSAQDNAFVLVALHHYFETFESVTPAFVARAWLGQDYVAEQAFDGRTTDRAAALVPMAELVGVGEGANVVLQKDGEGRLYYRLGLRYAPADLTLDARDEGFVVERTYEAVDDPADVQRDADGTWRIRAGATVSVTLTMVADARRTHVALIDPLPAGLEPVNPVLAVSQTFTPDTVDGDGTVRPYDAVLLVLELVRAPELARRPGRGVHQLPRGRHVRVPLHRQGHDRRRIRGAAGPRRGAVRARGLRPQRRRHRRRRLSGTLAGMFPERAGSYRYTSGERLPIEILVFEVDPADIDEFLAVDHDVWTIGEAFVPGTDHIPFLSKEVWLDDTRPGRDHADLRVRVTRGMGAARRRSPPAGARRGVRSPIRPSVPPHAGRARGVRLRDPPLEPVRTQVIGPAPEVEPS